MIHEVADIEQFVLDDSGLLGQLHLIPEHVMMEIILRILEMVKADLQREVCFVNALLLCLKVNHFFIGH